MAKSEKPVVVLVKGDDRAKNIKNALGKISEQIKLDIAKKVGKKGYIFIKPNFVTTRRQLAATHPDAVRAVLKYLRSFYEGEIIVGEGASIGNAFEGYKNYNYLPLEKEFNVRLMDLNHDNGIIAEGFNKNLKPLKLQIAKTLALAPYRISINPMKTHDSVIVTLSIKNMAVGSLIKSGFRPLNIASKIILRRPFHDYKSAIHQGPKATNKTIAKLYEKTKADLAVIDGFVGMERNGPVGGEPVELKIAIVSQDSLAADTLGVHLMGFNPQDIGYLHYLRADLKNITIIGERVENCRKKFRPHDTYIQQSHWK
ncbi:MAG: hypothetical protein COX39_00145 [Candidatus Nealsonbacteria bacterium CG23_combo_of_CG06-09_8_20_14_all_40_13]|uniref:DUF362 domain-containing protein n=1 Tax=Candidatus Nealsonbacteria bacterium CG23_combo_of_CG06-09_8_20_14_all_40_13 TaxID=1974724 RepID=A0A2G9YRT4_9BACT|nr:MAG: hypothetical protein COX39_00145 [Candidatus Nealsonbacteria bacterium CG23_combo_of_CG06-09_8_20_14_all_40_13]PIR70840.1 MAG: hypothetical protein COU44_02865 [Candidatus Nealsonbacteria bacterium CG10_big_fil_rev_8_21_14_0_10_40_24]PIU43069.1 MAG: hypothetical protein COS97_03110 [Candidatus Nealsonbacteria bacterium CG07_land_8_20_14_0_80_40_10]